MVGLGKSEVAALVETQGEGLCLLNSLLLGVPGLHAGWAFHRSLTGEVLNP